MRRHKRSHNITKRHEKREAKEVSIPSETPAEVIEVSAYTRDIVPNDNSALSGEERAWLTELEGEVEEVSISPETPAEVIEVSAYTLDTLPSDDSLLSGEEKARLTELEGEVERAFEIAGKALREIRDQRLYRGEYGTFEAYCNARFGFKRRQPYHIMKASAIAENLRARDVHIMPIGEYQIRPLAQIKESEKQAQAWECAIKKAHGKSPTHEEVRAAVKEVLGGSVVSSEPSSDGNLVHLGDVCVVRRTSVPLLSDRKGFWGLVMEVEEDFATIMLFDRTIPGVPMESLTALSLTDKEKQERIHLLCSLDTAYKACPNEEASIAVFHYFGRLQRAILTPFEEWLLSQLKQYE